VRGNNHVLFYSEQFEKIIVLISEDSLASDFVQEVAKLKLSHSIFTIRPESSNFQEIFIWKNQKDVKYGNIRMTIPFGLIKLTNELELFDGPEHNLNGSGALRTFIYSDDWRGDIKHISFKLTLSDDSILNLVWGITHTEEKFSLKAVRFDSRSEVENNRGFGYLAKDFDTDLAYDREQSDFSALPVNTPLIVNIFMSGKTLRVKITSQTVHAKDFTFNCDSISKNFGFISQQGKVTISDLRIK